jgi:hypothetical protein
VDSEQATRRERFPGSPTLRIDGQDIDSDAADRQDYGLKCRLYPTQPGALENTCSVGPGDPCASSNLLGGIRLQNMLLS